MIAADLLMLGVMVRQGADTVSMMRCLNCTCDLCNVGAVVVVQMTGLVYDIACAIKRGVVAVIA